MVVHSLQPRAVWSAGAECCRWTRWSSMLVINQGLRQKAPLVVRFWEPTKQWVRPAWQPLRRSFTLICLRKILGYSTYSYYWYQLAGRRMLELHSSGDTKGKQSSLSVTTSLFTHLLTHCCFMRYARASIDTLHCRQWYAVNQTPRAFPRTQDARHFWYTPSLGCK